jgi:hypothetical protein
MRGPAMCKPSSWRMWLVATVFSLMLTASVAAQLPSQRNGEGGGTDFVPLRQPHFVTAAQATFLKDGDRVVGVSENGVAKAYEPAVTAWHHVVEDQFGDMPMIVTWCSLCNTPPVYKSTVDGRKLTFARGGNRGNNFYMSDSETGSHWQQIGGDCFEGPMKGKRLTMVPFLYTTWGEWRAQHPQTLALVPEADRKAEYAGMAQRIASIEYGSNKAPGRELVRPADGRLPNYEEVIGIEAGGAHKAYPLPALQKTPVIDDVVGSVPVLMVYAAASDTTTAFSRVVNGRTLTFKGAEGAGLTDAETGSRWTSYGECTAGKLKGQKLGGITPQTGFWFAWAEFYPDTQVWGNPAGSN